MASGENVYLNQFDGYYALVATEDELRFPIGWLELLAAILSTFNGISLKDKKKQIALMRKSL